jgi:hypothetical protein
MISLLGPFSLKDDSTKSVRGPGKNGKVIEHILYSFSRMAQAEQLSRFQRE